MQWWFSTLVGLALQQLYVVAKEHHHIYKPGRLADGCQADDFRQSYWTRADQGIQGSAIVGTAFTQQIVWEHQHPPDCRTVNYLVWLPTNYGIGSNMHCMGQALALAMNLNRVLILAEGRSHPYYDERFCNNATSYHECYFEPISSCTLRDAALVLGAKEVVLDSISEVPEDAFKQFDRNPPDKVLKLSEIITMLEERRVPEVFDAFLSASPIDPRKHYYWWRAQSIAFLVRPTSRLLVEMHSRKKELFPQEIERGTISCHIRHGDKWTETELVKDEVYVSSIEHIFHKGQAEGIHLKRQVFLSTEDPESVIHFLSLETWRTAYLPVPRKPDPKKSTIEYARELGPANDMIHSMINLDLALQCDAWVGTLSSNWCRLIDELRSTVRCKAHGIYWDAQQENPPEDLYWK